VSRLRTIVIVDDEEDILDVLSLSLEGKDWTVLAFQSAKEALAYIERHAVDVVLSDVRMPGMSGVELFRQVRAKQPQLPFLLMTGFSAVDQPLLTAVPCQVLSKPFELAHLHKVLAETINR